MTANHRDIILIGYSGHALVVHEILVAQGYHPVAYMAPDAMENKYLNLPYWGSERDPDSISKLPGNEYFVAIGDNDIRERVSHYVYDQIHLPPVQAIAKSAYISPASQIKPGCLVGTGAIIHPGCYIGQGTIINTGSSIDHECTLLNYVHIGPGAVLCGNVSVGDGSFIGAGSTVIPGIKIGRRAIIGAGSVVLHDVPDGAKIAGNPARLIA
ncbi:MAG: acetyltransferase [Saprospiraceae bacterium]|nr:acetyltransferase [Saprospiraceae bacterium]